LEDNPQHVEPKTPGLIAALWDFFSSMKTAIALLLILAAASIAGTVITQNPDPEAYIHAHGQAQYKLFSALGLLNVYHSSWYGFLLTLIGISLTVCSVRRFRSTWQRTFRPKASASANQFAGMPRSESLSAESSSEDAASKVVTVLRSRSYHVLQEQDGGDIAIHATRGRASLWGPYLVHLSVLVIFVGAAFGSRLGFNGFVRIPEGSSVEGYYVDHNKPKDLGFRVALDTFTVEQDAQGNPTAYKSDLRVYDGGKLAAKKVIDVNHPLTYKGISFFQSTYGPVYSVLVTGPDGESKNADFYIFMEERQDGEPNIAAEEPFQEVRIGNEKLTLYVHGFAQDDSGGLVAQVMINDRFPEYRGLDAWKNLGWLSSKEVGYKDFSVRAELREYTGLQVARNPGLPVIYVGFGLMLLGVFVSFYMGHRTIRVRISPAEAGAHIQVGAVSRSETSVFDGDFAAVKGEFSHTPTFPHTHT